jgi:soluble lytic murein transglycosylase-like protein
MHGRPRLTLCAAVLSAVLGALITSSLQAGDALYYKEENGSIVFTNVGAAGLRRVPGFAARPNVLASKPLPTTEHDRYIEHLSNETGVSSDLIKAVAMVESGFDANARSSKGALGLMQLMPATARQYGVRNAYDPHQNLRGGATHLSSLLERYDGNLTLTLAAYNAGSTAVQRYDGVPPYPETRDYIRKVRDLLDGRRPARGAASNSRSVVSSPIRVIYAADGTISLVN